MSANWMVNCPVTGEPLFTGIRGSGSTFFVKNFRLYCKRCEAYHLLDGLNVYPEAAGSPEPGPMFDVEDSIIVASEISEETPNG